MAGAIYSTKNYKMFKKIIGNRDVSRNHVVQIINSIKRYGYFTNPVIVNERMEVIDGQHRIAALQELELPVDYIIIKGADSSYCQHLNWGHRNWTLRTFIKYRSDIGDGNYKLLDCLFIAHPLISNQVILSIANTPVRFFGAGTQDYLNGNLELSRKHYEWADDLLTRYEPIYKACKGIDTYKKGLYGAALFALTIPGIDEKRLLNVLSKRSTLRTDGTAKGCIETLDSLYNHGLSTRRIDIVGAWRSGDHIAVLENEWKTEDEEWQRTIGNRVKIG